jgi:predicted nucleic acid-binding protein
LIVLFDATFLMLFLDPRIKEGVGSNPRVDHLVDTLDKSRSRIIVPTPALSELLVGARDAAPAYLDIISRSRFFRIEPFGTKAAVEAADMTRNAIAMGDKRGGVTDSTWQKVKFDRQIVAIAKVTGCTTIYSDDDDVRRFAQQVAIPTVALSQLPDPPAPPQLEMRLDPLEAPEEDGSEGENSDNQ